jgi:glycosyltransferase involved in cell wall biosynthesis
LRVCFVSPEVFAWGYHGGFGFLTRTLGRELARRGVETCVVTVRRGDQGEQEELDGFTVLGYPPHTGGPRPFGSLLSRIDSVEYYRKADCDIYHSQAVSYNTLAAQGAMPGRLHIVTFQDPYDMDEWRKISRVNPRYRLTPAFRARLIAEVRLLSRACRRADGLYSQARFLIDKAMRLYRLDRKPVYLPNPVEVPRRPMGKSGDPKVCFLARWDPQKRVELFFELARGFPEVEFVAMGRSHDPEADNRLRKTYGGLPNVSLPGFVSEKEKSQILEESWALVNTSVREALPISFLEALAHETPIISSLDPDGLTSRFGYLAAGDNYAEEMRRMLADEGRRERGKHGRMYVEEEHELGRVVDRHLEIYKAHLEGRR